MPHRNPQKHKIARSFLQTVTNLVDIWMDKSSSTAAHTYIGVILTEAFYTPNPWVSAQYIMSRMGRYSIDTIRRRLEEMVDHGVAEVTEIDTKKVYRATPEAAEATVKVYEFVSTE